MAEPKPDPEISSSDKEKVPNLIVRAKEEIDGILHNEKLHLHHKETHGMRNDINENTQLDSVRAPNVFERAKEEIEALAEAIHHKKESSSHEIRDESPKTESKLKQENSGSLSENNAHAPNIFVRAKEEIGAIIHHDKSPHHHHKETHGMSDDIDEKTPISEVKGPNVFERAKEEIEAIFQTIHPKKEKGKHVSSPKKEGGFRSTLGRGLEKVCSPRNTKIDKE
ncbi:DEAD-box ATP-dependent RNA helicase [Quillaja saponaria]|uniref:DEAD-box ATP-dependent RNA helicase n=1 Tax=Quillaja saponaria TaxID=32244 RepID=A0AAD7VKP1_QUISA|nr:DEAD-box ATP-dependent RNA helicase [Quillaja saponaria]